MKTVVNWQITVWNCKFTSQTSSCNLVFFPCLFYFFLVMVFCVFFFFWHSFSVNMFLFCFLLASYFLCFVFLFALDNFSFFFQIRICSFFVIYLLFFFNLLHWSWLRVSIRIEIRKLVWSETDVYLHGKLSLFAIVVLSWSWIHLFRMFPNFRRPYIKCIVISNHRKPIIYIFFLQNF